MKRPALVTACVVGATLIIAGCGGDDDALSPKKRDDGLYEVTTMVVDSPKAPGPMLCLGASGASFPPVCGDVLLVGWDWSRVEGETIAGDVTFGTYSVVGVFDGERFTVAQRPVLVE
jgi:hypothetical protein